MTTDTATLFFAMLAVLAQLTVIATALFAIGARLSPSMDRAWQTVREAVGPQALGLASAVAFTCMAGSLYLSEVAHFLPCRLCWLQRFAMYPLGPLLAVAAIKKWYGVRWSAIALAAAGACVSVYHLLIERYPSLEGSTSCDPNNPCSIIWVKRFGYLTIPGMALSGFALIITLLLLARPSSAAPASAPTLAQEAP